MSGSLVRLIYASTATFKANEKGGVEVAVGQILSESRRNNKRQRVGGVLHYGNGYFFQCLEGEREAVDACYNRISEDDRHRDVQCLSYVEIDSRMFPDWSMKYLPVEDEITRLLKHYNTDFNPYRFSNAMLMELLKACARGHEPEATRQTAADQTPAPKRPFWKRLFGKS
ncbi:BLUF domain-containing protein [Salicola sp. Rm-C-2C1-2]|uniref:BLUF domain-containing protein n=1 Tax=Salicola sp. Rm-C-2C1-2 TaxID=3141321 RepID=UPI0032E43AE2